MRNQKDSKSRGGEGGADECELAMMDEVFVVCDTEQCFVQSFAVAVADWHTSRSFISGCAQGDNLGKSLFDAVPGCGSCHRHGWW